MLCSLLASTVLVLLSTVSAHNISIIAHVDPQCVKNLTAPAPSDFSQVETYPAYYEHAATTYPGAEAPGGGGGYNVWWGIDSIPEGCRLLLMLPYTESAGILGGPAGNQLLNTRVGGCFSTSVPVSSPLYASLVCGAKDIEAADVGDAEFDNGAGTVVTGRSITATAVTAAIQQEQPAKQTSALAKRDDSAHIGKRYYYPPQPSAPAPQASCAVTPGTAYSRAGRQVAVSDVVTCSSTPCSVSVSHSVAYSSSMTSTKTQTFTVSAGVSVSISAGIDFIADSSISTAVHTDLSNAWSSGTSTAITQTNTTTVTTSFGSTLGSKGLVTFTPAYKCWKGPIDCGFGPSEPIEFCQPVLDSLSSISGDFMFLAIG